MSSTTKQMPCLREGGVRLGGKKKPRGLGAREGWGTGRRGRPEWQGAAASLLLWVLWGKTVPGGQGASRAVPGTPQSAAVSVSVSWRGRSQGSRGEGSPWEGAGRRGARGAFTLRERERERERGSVV